MLTLKVLYVSTVRVLYVCRYFENATHSVLGFQEALSSFSSASQVGHGSVGKQCSNGQQRAHSLLHLPYGPNPRCRTQATRTHQNETLLYRVPSESFPQEDAGSTGEVD